MFNFAMVDWKVITVIFYLLSLFDHPPYLKNTSYSYGSLQKNKDFFTFFFPQINSDAYLI